MTKITRGVLCLLLSLLICIPFFTMNASAVGEVYTVDGQRTVFAATAATALVDGETYNTYQTLRSAFAALGTGGGVIVICGDFTDPTSAGDSTFADVSGRGHVLIKGDTSAAILRFNHTLSFYGGPITLENFKLHCWTGTANNTKYVIGGGNTVFGEGFTTGGNIYYRNTSNAMANARSEFNTAATFAQMNMAAYADIGSASSATPALAELVFNNVNLTCPINGGFSNVSGKQIYGNVNVIVNGGTYSNKSLEMSNMTNPATGAVTAIFNNGLGNGFTVSAEYKYVVKSAVGGTVTIKTQAPFGGAPVFLLTPNEGLVPAVNGSVIFEENGEYLLSPTASASTQNFDVTWTNPEAPTEPSFYTVNGRKTAFVKDGGGVANYDGHTVYAYNSILNACIANTSRQELDVIIIGNVTYNLSMPNNAPAILTISGADADAALDLTGYSHPWGSTVFEDIKLSNAGCNFCADGKKIIFGDGLTGNMPTTLYGGGSGSPHGGNLTLNSGKYATVYVGSDAATTTAGAGHILTVNGGDFTEATIDAGSKVSAGTIPGNVLITINGGTFATTTPILLSNVTEVGGIKAVIINNGLSDDYTFNPAEGFDYVIKSADGGTVSYDGSKFVLSADSGKGAVVNGVYNANGYIPVGTPGTYNVTWINAEGTAAVYTIDGVKTAFVKTGGGLAELDSDGNPRYAYSDIRAAISAACGGKVIVIGKYTGSVRDYWGGSGVTTVTGYDSNAVWTVTGFYNWTPLVIENLSLTPSADNITLNADARDFVIGDGVTVTSNGFNLVGGGGSTNRNIDVTINSGKLKSLRAGNSATIGTTGTPYYMKLTINGGDFSEATINTGNSSVTTLYGNVAHIINGGTFAQNQTIAFDNVDVIGKSSLVIADALVTEYNLSLSENYDYILKYAVGGTVEYSSYGNDIDNPTFILTPNDTAKAPAINGSILSANTQGVYSYTPTLSETQTVESLTWVTDNRAKAYNLDGVLTAFVSAEPTFTNGDTTYYTFPNLTDAVAALGGNEGEVILTSDVTLTGGDGGAFVDTADREAITVKGFTGNEVLNIDGTFGFKGAVTLDDFTLCILKSTYAKYIAGYSEVTFGENFNVDDVGGGFAYFSSVKGTSSVDRNLSVTLNGGKFAAFNVSGMTSGLIEGKIVDVEINGGTISSFNLGMSESGTVNSNVNVVINSDVITSKTIGYNSTKTTAGDAAVFTVIVNNGISGYSISADANAVLDYIIYSAVGGKTSIYTQGTITSSPTFELVPDEGFTPKVGSAYIERVDGKYLYTPSFTGTRQSINVTWVPLSELNPVVYTVESEKYAFVKAGGGIVSFADEPRFAYPDLNTAVAALGTAGGNIYLSGDCRFIDGSTDDSNIFADVNGREVINIRGIDGTEPRLIYYRSMNLKGDITMDSMTYHRILGTVNDQGIYYRGYNVTFGENFVSTTEGTSAQNLQIYAASYENRTFPKKAVFDISAGTITSLFCGTTYGGYTITGSTEINLKGGSIGTIYGGSHGGSSSDSISIGDVEINISGGSVNSLYTGVNTKTKVVGNVKVNITGGNLSGSYLYHGNANNIATNSLDGNSIYVISGGNLSGAVLASGGNRGVTGKCIFIVNNTVEDYTYTQFEGGTFISYAPEGTVDAVTDENGNFVGYSIICEDTAKDIIIDGAKVERNSDNVYTLADGEHTVLFSTLRQVTFDANGADGTVPIKLIAYNGVTVALPTPTELSKLNCEFVGWNTDDGAESGESYITIPDSNTTLYAIWREIKPQFTENSNIENSDAERVVVTSIAKDDYLTNTSVITAADYISSDAIANQHGGAVAYAYEMRAYEQGGTEVTEFENGLNFMIPKSVLPTVGAGQVLRLYKVNGENVSIIPFTEDENYMYYTDFSSGDYAVILTNAEFGSYTYRGSFNSAESKYTLSLYMKGVKASYASFGLKYDTALLTLNAFTFGSDVIDVGNISEESGGFGTYYCANGIYQNTWRAASGTFVDSSLASVKIGDFVFTTSEGFTAADVNTFVVSNFAESGVAVSADTLETVYDNGYYLYAPYINSVEVYCQPMTSTFEIGLDKHTVSADFVLARASDNTFYNDSVTAYNSEASVTITDDLETVYSITESSMTVETDAGYDVLKLSCSLPDGAYTLTLTKNGYVAHTENFTVDGSAVSLGKQQLAGGDIKSSYANSYGDGVVDIDDFIRLVRGFSPDASDVLRQTVDINEDSFVTIEDLAILKSSLSR